MKVVESHKPFTVAIDYDGTMIHHPMIKGNYGEEPIAVPHAIEWCQRFDSLGIRLILWTSRGSQDDWISHAVCYMQKIGINLYGINNNPDQIGWSDSRKIHAHVYVDDNGLAPLCYPIPGKRGVVNWKIAGHMVLERFNNKDVYYS